MGCVLRLAQDDGEFWVVGCLLWVVGCVLRLAQDDSEFWVVGCGL